QPRPWIDPHGQGFESGADIGGNDAEPITRLGVGTGGDTTAPPRRRAERGEPSPQRRVKKRRVFREPLLEPQSPRLDVGCPRSPDREGEYRTIERAGKQLVRQQLRGCSVEAPIALAAALKQPIELGIGGWSGLRGCGAQPLAGGRRDRPDRGPLDAISSLRGAVSASAHRARGLTRDRLPGEQPQERTPPR